VIISRLFVIPGWCVTQTTHGAMRSLYKSSAENRVFIKKQKSGGEIELIRKKCPRNRVVSK